MILIPLRDIIRAFRIPGLLLLTCLSVVRAQDDAGDAAPDDGGDMLAYVSDAGSLMLYDPRARTEVTLVDKVERIVISDDRRVAFTHPDPVDTDIYIFDLATPDLRPVGLSLDQAFHHYPGHGVRMVGRWRLFLTRTATTNRFSCGMARQLLASRCT